MCEESRNSSQPKESVIGSTGSSESGLDEKVVADILPQPSSKEADFKYSGFRPGRPVRFYRIGAFVFGLLLMLGSLFAVYALFFRPSSHRVITLYFSNFSRTGLVKVDRFIPEIYGKQKLLHRVMQELCYGPVANDTLPSVPGGTTLLNVWQKGATAYVDLSSQLYLGLARQGGAEILAAYAIVNTVMKNISGIQKVQILVNGNPLPVLRGLVTIAYPLKSRPDLILER